MEPATDKQVKFAKNLNCWQEGMTKQECRLAIDRALGAAKEDVKPEVVKPGAPAHPKNGQASMYVSYAKDVFCTLREENQTDASITMALAIELVKQAKEAFE